MMQFIKKYKKRKYFDNELKFYNTYAHKLNLPELLDFNFENQEICWEWIQGIIPKTDEIAKILQNFQDVQNSEILNFKKFNYAKLEPLIKSLFDKKILKTCIDFQKFDLLSDSDRKLAHGDAHRFNFIKNNNNNNNNNQIYIVDTEFCSLASPMYDFAKLFLFEPNLILNLNEKYEQYHYEFKLELFLRACVDFYGISKIPNSKFKNNLKYLQKIINEPI